MNLYTKPNTMEEIKIQGHAKFWIGEEGILHCKLSNSNMDKKLDYKTAQLYLEAIETLSKGRPMPLLIDLRSTKGTFSSAAAQLLAKSWDNMPSVLCEGYVVSTLSVKLLVQAYKRIYKTKIPFGIFNNLNKATEYCLSHNN